VDGIATLSIPLTTGCNFLSHPAVTHITKAWGIPNLRPAKCRVFWLFVQRARVRATICPDVGSRMWAVKSVLLIGGQVMRATVRTLMHDNSTETLEMFSRQDLKEGTFIGDCLHSHEAA
jgi:hypothetical protein